MITFGAHRQTHRIQNYKKSADQRKTATICRARKWEEGDEEGLNSGRETEFITDENHVNESFIAEIEEDETNKRMNFVTDGCLNSVEG